MKRTHGYPLFVIIPTHLRPEQAYYTIAYTPDIGMWRLRLLDESGGLLRRYDMPTRADARARAIAWDAVGWGFQPGGEGRRLLGLEGL